MAVQLVRHRKKLTNIERILKALALTMGGWHTSNLAVNNPRSFRSRSRHLTTFLRVADTVAVVSITFAYSSCFTFTCICGRRHTDAG